MHFAIRAKFEAFKYTDRQKASNGLFSKPGIIEEQIPPERNLKAAQPHSILQPYSKDNRGSFIK